MVIFFEFSGKNFLGRARKKIINGKYYLCNRNFISTPGSVLNPISPLGYYSLGSSGPKGIGSIILGLTKHQTFC